MQAHGGEVVLELDLAIRVRSIGAAGRQAQARRAIAAHMAEVEIRQRGDGPLARAVDDDRRGAVAHLQQVHELAVILGRTQRIEEHGAGLRADDGDGPVTAADEAARDHEGVRESRARLAQLDVRTVVADELRDQSHVRRHRRRRTRRVTDQIAQIIGGQTRLVQRPSQSFGAELAVAVAGPRPLATLAKVAAHVARLDAQPPRDRSPNAPHVGAEARRETIEQLVGR